MAATVNIKGITSCGEWVKGREEKGYALVLVQPWLTGYLSGIALGSGREFWKKDSGELDYESVALWMDNYCKANPLKNIGDGGSLLFQERTKK